MAFMEDFECEAYKLGIPVKTRHNEVAPNQFECCLLYTSDAADERSSVDLGGRRIIKKKTTKCVMRRRIANK